MEKNFVVEKDGTTLNVILCPELNEETTSAVVDEMLKYYGQGIERVVFNATALVKLERIGLRTIYYAHAKLGSQPEPEIVFVNCEPEIKKVFNYVELDHIVKFEEQQEAKKTYRRVILNHSSMRRPVSRKMSRRVSAGELDVCTRCPPPVQAR